MKLNIPIYQRVQQQLDQISLITRENLMGVRVIRAFARQEEEKNASGTPIRLCAVRRHLQEKNFRSAQSSHLCDRQSRYRPDCLARRRRGKHRRADARGN